MRPYRAWFPRVGVIAATAAGVAVAATPPALTITTPKNGAVVRTSRVVVSGTYSGFTGDHCLIDGSNDCTLFEGGGVTRFKGPAALHAGKNTITVIVVAGGSRVSGSVTVTSHAPPRTNRSYGGRGQPAIRFTITVRHGKITQLRRFGWDRLPCGAGKTPNSDELHHAIPVTHNHFRITASLPIESGVRLTVSGRFNAALSEATGVIEAAGACNSGARRWRAHGK